MNSIEFCQPWNTGLATLVEGESAIVASILGQFILDNVHRELTAHDIWIYLEKLGYHRRRWGNDPHILATVDDANKRYLEPLRDAFIIGKMIPRDETQVALNKLTSSIGNRGVLLAGEAGVGKSSVLFQIIDCLRERGVPIVAFRVDRLEPTLLPDQVGEQLGFPGSPVNVLASVSAGRECVLVIDQLDAVSLASGRNPQFFECVNEIIKQNQAYPKMHLLLACRKFDLENDDRLRRLADEHRGIADVVPIQRLKEENVRGIVSELGLDKTRLNQKQLNLLSVPLHLSILAEITKDSTVDALAFNVAKDLYSRYWAYKQRVIRERTGRVIEWTHVIDTLCEYMSNHQILSAPKDVLGDFMVDAEVMASEHVLVLDQQRFAFSHEGFFDYAFAHRFVMQGHNLSEFLLSSEQHLFRRAQVRQVLLHERDLDHARYLIDLNDLIVNPQIRFHIKEAVFALLTDSVDPMEEEWNILNSLLSHDAILGSEVWRILYGSKPWFQLLDSLKLINKWLADSNAERIDRTIELLSSMQKQFPDRVAELVEPYIGTSAEWRNRLAYLVRWADEAVGQRFFTLFLRLIDEGVLDELKGAAINSDFWSFLYPLHTKNPARACEAIGHYLNRRLEISLSLGQNNPFDDRTGTIKDSQFDEKILTETARGAPQQFVDQVLPFMLRVIGLTIDTEGKRPLEDKVWWYRSFGRGYRVESALLSGMQVALGILAAQQPDIFVT